jgi:hypothetical protein
MIVAKPLRGSPLLYVTQNEVKRYVVGRVARVQIPVGAGPGIHFGDAELLSSGGRPEPSVGSISHCAPSALISPPFGTGGKRREIRMSPLH